MRGVWPVAGQQDFSVGKLLKGLKAVVDHFKFRSNAVLCKEK